MIPDMCEVRMNPRMGWNLMDIWFIQYRHDRTASVHYPDGTSKIFKEGDDIIPAPSLTLRPETLKHFLQAAKEQNIPSDSMHDHLQDAIKVRDRLLTIVERSVK